MGDNDFQWLRAIQETGPGAAQGPISNSLEQGDSQVLVDISTPKALLELTGYDFWAYVLL